MNCHYTKHLYLGLLLVFFEIYFQGIQLYAQENFPVDTLKVAHFAQKQGLSQLNVGRLDFDENGYLWAGTEDGLNRFNGYEMKVFSKGLTDDHIRGLTFTNDTLWLATNTESVSAYVLSQDKFINFNTKEVIQTNQDFKLTNYISKLNDNFLLASALKNCLLINRKTLEVKVIPLPNQETNDYVLCTYQVTDNIYKLGTFFNGVVTLNLQESSIHKDLQFSSFKDNPVYAIYSKGNSGLYLGTEKGLYYFDKKTKSHRAIYNPKEKNPIRCFFPWNDNTLLIGCYKGLLLFDETTSAIKPLPIQSFEKKRISPVEIVQIKKDNHDGVWFATEGKGILYYNPFREKFKPYRIQLDNHPKEDYISIFNFLRKENTLWMTTQFGFVKHQLGSNSYKLYKTNRLGYTLITDKENNIWGGGFNQGLRKYNSKLDTFKEINFANFQLPDRDVIELSPVSNDSLWVATWSSGMYAFNTKNQKAKPIKVNGESLNRARASFIDYNNCRWIGTDEGLYKISNKETVHYQHQQDNKHSLSNNRIFSITEDAQKNIWVGTAKGLNRIDKNGKITPYTSQPGLPNDFIYGVLADKHDNIWVSTNYGISTLNITNQTFKNYTEEDGLQNNEFNGKAAYKDSLGNLYFGGMNGYNIINPDKIPMNTHVGKTIIEQVELFGKPLAKNSAYQDTLRFNHNENVLTFKYTVLNYLLPDKNHYQFKMDGFDKKWRPITQAHSTTYTNLNPGTYTFYVKGSNNEYVWGKPAAITIIISSPWYATWYVKLGFLLFLIICIISFFLYRNYKQQQENLKLQRMVTARTKELRVANEELNKALETAQGQKENISFLMRELNHRVKNNLQLITSLLDIQKATTTSKLTQNTLQSAQNRLFTIAKIHDLLSVNKPEDLLPLDVFIEKLANELTLFMEADVKLQFDLIPLKITKKQLTPIGIILNELVTNSLKHAFPKDSQDKIITISLTTQGNKAIITYTDNGKGFPKDWNRDNKSLGMKLIENLTRQLGGEIEILPTKKGVSISINFVL